MPTGDVWPGYAGGRACADGWHCLFAPLSTCDAPFSGEQLASFASSGTWSQSDYQREQQAPVFWDEATGDEQYVLWQRRDTRLPTVDTSLLLGTDRAFDEGWRSILARHIFRPSVESTLFADRRTAIARSLKVHDKAAPPLLGLHLRPTKGATLWKAGPLAATIDRHQGIVHRRMVVGVTAAAAAEIPGLWPEHRWHFPKRTPRRPTPTERAVAAIDELVMLSHASSLVCCLRSSTCQIARLLANASIVVDIDTGKDLLWRPLYVCPAV